MSSKNIESIHRLAPVQEGVLFHSLEAGNASVYFGQYHCEFDGAVDSERLRFAWEKVIARHGVLRTLFSWEGRKQPLQIVRERVGSPWQYADWGDFPAAEQERRWRSLVSRDRDRGFEFSKAPLIRLTLVRLSDNRHRFLFSFHHILMDGWSTRLVLNEALNCYRDASDDVSLDIAPQYGEFIKWLEAADGEAAKRFWTSQLSGFSVPTFPAPGNRERGGRSNASETVEVLLSQSDSDDLEKESRAERVTLNTMVVAAWSLVLGRYAGTRDVVFGTTVSGRPVDLDGAQEIVGLFINTLPVRIGVPSEGTVREWLRSIQKQQLQMRDFEHTPLTVVQRCSDVPPGTPLFETIVVFENFPQPASGSSAAIKVNDEHYSEFSHYPLALLAVPGPEIKLIAVFDENVFGRQSVADLLESFRSTLMSIGLSMGHTMKALTGELELSLSVNAGEKSHRSVAGDTAGLSECFLHGLIEATADRLPDQIAVVDSDEQLSYSELDSRSNRFANYLRENEIRPGALVPIIAERSAEAIVAILAILKTGAAYVPIDPAVPDDRLGFLIGDLSAANDAAGMRTVLVTTVPRAVDDVDTICIEEARASIAAQDDEKREPEIDGNSLAYVIYTSGTTGQPKGVMVSHRNLAYSTNARHAVYKTPFSAFLLLSSLATDSSVAGLFWTLASGATLVLPRARQEQDPEQIARLIAKTGVSHLLCVPSLYRLLLEHAPASELVSLNTVIVAGEACGGDVVRRHHRAIPGVLLFNEYGPTETTVWASVAELKPDQPVTIGSAIAGTRLHILGPDQKPVPAGVAGELYIGGGGVARGYLNDAKKTHARFVADTVTGSADARLYRTGDRVRIGPDGRLMFLGRVDNQIKVRGYRVEPEEIETALAEHPDIVEAAVFIKESGDCPDEISDLLDELLALAPEAAAEILSTPEPDHRPGKGIRGT